MVKPFYIALEAQQRIGETRAEAAVYHKRLLDKNCKQVFEMNFEKKIDPFVFETDKPSI